MIELASQKTGNFIEYEKYIKIKYSIDNNEQDIDNESNIDNNIICQ